MSGLYLVDMVAVLRAAGCTVAESTTTNGWQTRARSSGGFPDWPLGVQWHHTASATSPANDLSYMIVGCDDAPVGNVLLDRDGVYWPIAAGAANTAGKGGPVTMSRGVVKADNANATTFAVEAANAGTEPWPAAQIDAYFAGSNALNAWFGNVPGDVFSHALGAGDGWTSRKIDPARADAVAGPWRPPAVNSSSTWSLAAIRAECARRAAPAPAPPSEDDDVTKHLIIVSGPGGQYEGAVAVAPPDLSVKTWLQQLGADNLRGTGDYHEVVIDGSTFDAIPNVLPVDTR